MTFRTGTWVPCQQRSHVIERYGPNKNMVDLRLELAGGCPKIAANQIMDLCGVIYPDRISQKECRCAFATVAGFAKQVRNRSVQPTSGTRQ